MNQGLRVDVAMLGGRNYYAVPKLLHQAGVLGRLYTDTYAGNKPWTTNLLRAVPRSIRPSVLDRFLGRCHKELPADRVVSFDAFGIWYLWQTRRALSWQALDQVYAKGGAAFARRVVRYGLLDANVLYGYSGAGVELFQYAKEHGVRCILEQHIAPQDIARRLLREERERWPGWELRSCTGDGNSEIGQREQQEWRLVDMIVGGSSFVVDGLLQHQVPQEKCRIVPYGVCLKHFFPEERRPSSSPGKLRILFAGGVQLRKGVPYLLEALRLLNSPYIEARLAGPVDLSPAKLAPYQGLATFLGPVARARMADLFRWADVFVFPSICEGSALVTYEALASGLPVIATPNTGSRVRHGTDGMIVPVRDVEALATALQRFARDRQFLRFCCRNAVAGRSRLGLEAYQQKLLEVCSEANRRIPADEKV